MGFVRQKYLDSHLSNGDIVLRHHLQVVDDSVEISELDVYDDRLIVLEMVAMTDSPTHDNSGERALHAEDQCTQQLSPSRSITSGIAPSSPSEPILPVMSPEEKIKLPAQDQISTLTHSGNSPPSMQSSHPAHLNVTKDNFPPPNPEKAHGFQESALNVAEMQQGNRRTVQLQTLLRSGIPDVLETGVERGVELLCRLKALMMDRMTNDLETQQRLKQIGSFYNPHLSHLMHR